MLSLLMSLVVSASAHAYPQVAREASTATSLSVSYRVTNCPQLGDLQFVAVDVNSAMTRLLILNDDGVVLRFDGLTADRKGNLYRTDRSVSHTSAKYTSVISENGLVTIDTHTAYVGGISWGDHQVCVLSRI